MDKLTLNEYLNRLLLEHRLKNDAALAKAARIGPPTICKLRHARLPMTAGVFCKLHEHLGVQMADLRAVLDPAEFSLELQGE